TDKATVVGLILNELGTNALKHGFSNEATPWFAVTLEARHESEICVMTVQHNGAPLPEDVEAFASGISGLGLVRSLVSQIRGTLDIEGHPRPTFRIVFPIG
ncbi:MAG: ATP-binding protein, partial [Spirochaetota bacterium]